MANVHLELDSLNKVDSLRKAFNDELNLQTLDNNLKADLRLKFDKWLTQWSLEAYQNGVYNSTI